MLIYLGGKQLRESEKIKWLDERILGKRAKGLDSALIEEIRKDVIDNERKEWPICMSCFVRLDR